MLRWPCLLILLLAGLPVLPGESGTVRVVRTYGGDDADFVDLSPDGQMLLVRTTAWAACHPGGRTDCRTDTLSVYRTDTGQTVATLRGTGGNILNTTATAFVAGNLVSLIQRSRDGGQRWSEWDPLSGRVSAEVPLPAKAPALCIPNRGSVLSLVPPPDWKQASALVLTVRQPSGLRQGEPVPHKSLWRYYVSGRTLACREILTKDALLIRGGSRDLNRRTASPLFRLSLQSAEADRDCTVADATLHAHAVSPDGTFAAVITSSGPDADDGTPPYAKVFLTILKLPDCQVSSRQELVFPERPQRRVPLFAPSRPYWAGARFGDEWRVAISPGNSELAIGYGVLTGGPYSDCWAVYGLYSLPTAQRLATWRGDVWRNGLWQTLRQFDAVPTQIAPLAGMLAFSPDGQTLFAGSRRVWQWDLHALRRPKTAGVSRPLSTGWSAPVPLAPPPSGWPSKFRTASVADRN